MLPRSRPTVAANRAINTWDKYLPPGQQTIGEPLRKINDSMLCDWNPRSTAKANGDGSFVVPGPDGPLATIRLVNIRDGVEDVELFQRARAKCGDLPVRRALERAVANSTSHTSNATLLEGVRRHLGRAAAGLGPCSFNEKA